MKSFAPIAIIAIITATMIGAVTDVAVRAEETNKAGTQELYDRCIRNDLVCAPFLMGVASVQILLGTAYQDPEFLPNFIAPLKVFAICPKKEPVNGNVLRQRFISWAEKNPNERTETMGAGAMHAFLEAWPCARRLK